MRKQAFILGSESGYYVQALLRNCPAHTKVQVIAYENLTSTLALGPPEVIYSNYPISHTDLLLVRSMGKGNLESIVFRMDCLAALQHLGCRVLNPPKALEWAIDKYASLSRLVHYGIPILPTHISQDFEKARNGFLSLGSDVVVKPLFGAEGRGLMRVCDTDHADRVFRSLTDLQHVIYQQQFLSNCRDVRILIVGDDHWAIERHSDLDWRKNTSRGSLPKVIEPDSTWIELARSAARCLDLPIAGVDLLIDKDLKPFVLEVNGVPGWRGIEQVHPVNIAKQMWAFAQK